MQKLINYVIKQFYLLFNYKKYRQFDDFDKRLQAAIIKEQRDREVNQLVLKHEIIKYMRRYMKIDARSRYIPRDNKSRIECIHQVNLLFGDDMLKYGVGIKEDLTLCIL